MIKNLYCDGGCAKKNPSPYGVSWAFIATDENNLEVYRESGRIIKENCKGYKASNNLAEMVAAVKALEYAVQNIQDVEFPIKLHSDSELTINRLFKGYSMSKLPSNVQKRAIAALSSLRNGTEKNINPILVAGHPTKKELKQGFKTKDNRNFPVSSWNVECDRLCTEQSKLLYVGIVD